MVIKYDTTLKASGKEYTRIVFWNRFLRNPAELILSWLPAIASVVLLAMGIYSFFSLILYAVFWAYPIYIFAHQFKSSVNYHLKHRDPSEDAPCNITFLENGILASIPDHGLNYNYEWEQFTCIYNKFGYYMLFNGGKMIVMLRQADMPEEIRNEVPKFIKAHVDRNKCRVLF